mmetsp:Transcript_22733/g.33244  ORF Transcript_22733/g.33244 Transcript_22733/m.33244 type:complete len:147 (+) Transcript_22733:92-532(+)|eukprot:CAMPEP_0195516452 /NCGR_PEP_ID=MMETSP0794_2-20130614/7177_1 /TAXON_ID=515487 /ORGANISM="Stephanopyxis turris, Strain CCMP 815" /LENGTH=146 /DNA_ID=CAMNT_0040645049 /DNA_START=92 /DNA_END=532 /DNA_ORIENTATION=-
MKSLFILLLVLNNCSAWIVSPIALKTDGLTSSFASKACRGISALSLGNNDEDEDDSHVHMGMDEENPCWQDIYEYDCAMSTVYSASFVAKDWIKGMPCAKGIEDCDMPEGMTRPGHEGVDSEDVIDFLGIKRVDSLGETKTVDKKK